MRVASDKVHATQKELMRSVGTVETDGTTMKTVPHTTDQNPTRGKELKQARATEEEVEEDITMMKLNFHDMDKTDDTSSDIEDGSKDIEVDKEDDIELLMEPDCIYIESDGDATTQTGSSTGDVLHGHAERLGCKGVVVVTKGTQEQHPSQDAQLQINITSAASLDNFNNDFNKRNTSRQPADGGYRPAPWNHDQ